MAKTKVDIRELNTLADEIAKASSDTQANVNKAVHMFAILIDRKAKEKISKGQRTGRTYEQGKWYRRAGGRGTFQRILPTHQSSAPGEPPKTDTGRLVSSIHFELGDMSAEVGSLANIAKYGAELELGTKYVAKRPWLEPTLKENADELVKGITNAIKSGGLV